MGFFGAFASLADRRVPIPIPKHSTRLRFDLFIEKQTLGQVLDAGHLPSPPVPAPSRPLALRYSWLAKWVVTFQNANVSSSSQSKSQSELHLCHRSLRKTSLDMENVVYRSIVNNQRIQ